MTSCSSCPRSLIVYLLHPVPLVWMLAATVAVFATLVTANCIGIFIANFTSSPADVLLYATAILFPLIYVSGFFRNQNPTGILETLRGFVPFAYTNDALKTVFGLTTNATPLEILIYPTVICAVLAFAVCLTAPRLLSTPVASAYVSPTFLAMSRSSQRSGRSLGTVKWANLPGTIAYLVFGFFFSNTSRTNGPSFSEENPFLASPSAYCRNFATGSA